MISLYCFYPEINNDFNCPSILYYFSSEESIATNIEAIESESLSTTEKIKKNQSNPAGERKGSEGLGVELTDNVGRVKNDKRNWRTHDEWRT